jgi:hypothetical protein
MRWPSEDHVLIGLAVTFAVWVFGVLPFLYGPSPRFREAGSPPQAHSAQTQQDAKGEPRGTTNAPFVVKVETTNETQDRREKASTDWWLMVFTGAVALFTLMLVGATILLYRAGERQLEHLRKSFEATERAFVFLDGFNAELTNAINSKIEIDKLPERYRSCPQLFLTRFTVQPKWKNGGNMPTEKMTVLVNWRGPIGPIPPDYVYKNSPEPFFLAPKAVDPSAFIEITGAQSLIDYGLNPLGAEPLMLIWGRADYEDVFNRHHFVQWCCRVRFDDHKGEGLRASFIQWGDYNRSGEIKNPGQD